MLDKQHCRVVCQLEFTRENASVCCPGSSNVSINLLTFQTTSVPPAHAALKVIFAVSE